MSSRQRRLFMKAMDVVELPPRDESSGASEDEAPLNCVPSSNPFALLEEDEDTSPSAPVNVIPPSLTSLYPMSLKQEEVAAVSEEPMTVSVRQTSKKKSKKKNKKKKPSDDDEIDRIVRDINAASGTIPNEEEQSNGNDMNMTDETHSRTSVFVLMQKSLRGDEELGKMFGSKVVAAVEAELEQKRREEAGFHGRPSQHNTRRFIRRFLLLTPRPEWQPKASCLSMTYDGDVFCYVATSDYSRIHTLFLECQDLGDPHAMGAFLQSHPFHVEALLAMHDFLMTTNQHLHAEECLNRALFSLEAVWHKDFNPHSGRCRLDRQIELNHLLLKAIFRHIQHLSRRGCPQTAFDCGKFLLSLDVTDPMGILSAIDYLAIRAGAFGFLEKLIEELEDGPSLAIRPGIAFSLALCKFKRGEVMASKEAVVETVLMHPLALSRLLGKATRSGVRLDGRWNAVMTHGFFAKATDGNSASLNHLVNLFVERHHSLYKSPEVLEWLLEGVQLAIDQLDHGRSQSGLTVDDWSCIRTAAFPEDITNHYRHLHLYDFSDEIERLPEDVLRGNDAMADIEERMAQELQQQGGMRGVVRLGEEELRNANPLTIFLRSLLPWVQPDENHERNA